MTGDNAPILAYQTPGDVGDDGLTVTLQPTPVIWEVILLVAAGVMCLIGIYGGWMLAVHYLDTEITRERDIFAGGAAILLAVGCAGGLLRTFVGLSRRFTFGHLPNTVDVCGEMVGVHCPAIWGPRKRQFALSELHSFSIGLSGITIACRRAYVLILLADTTTLAQVRFSPYNDDQLKRIRLQMNNILRIARSKY